MERSFSRRGGLGVPGPGHFARESTPGSLDLRDRNSRTRYLDGEMQLVRARTAEQTAAAQASRWGRQVDAMDTSEIDSFSPRTPDEQRWKASADLVTWKHPFKNDPISPAFPESRSGGHHPAQKPLYKDIDRAYSLRPSWERDVFDEELDKEIDEELEALLAERRERRI